MKVKCIRCGRDAKKVEYLRAHFIKCDFCKYDESALYDIAPEKRSSQREKTRYSPYKTGGKQRSRR